MAKLFRHDLVKPPVMERVTGADGRRYYQTKTGERYLSVTTFLSQHSDKTFLKEWRARVGDKKADQITKAATDRGTALHGSLEKYLMNENVVITNLIQKQRFIRMKPLVERIDNIRLLEKSLYSEKLLLAGTPDCIADFDKELSVIDFKTSNWEKEEKHITDYYLQTACYGIMYHEHYGILPKSSVILMMVDHTNNPVLFKQPMIESIKMLQNYYTEHKIRQK